MKRETIKEVGKLFLDLSKIIFAITIITPLAKDGYFEVMPLVFGTLSAVFGVYLTNKGVSDE